MPRWIWIVLGIAVLAAIVFASAANLGLFELDPHDPPLPAPRPGLDEDLAEEAESLMELLEEGEPAYTLEEVEAWCDELIPLVEQAAGRPFTKRPRIEVVDRESLADALAQLAYEEFEPQLPGFEEDDVWQMAWDQASMLAPAVLGIYEHVDRVIYMAPTNLEPARRLMDLPPGDLEPIARLVVAHELTHALQDQHVPLASTIAGADSGDAVEAFLATIEGHATFVAEVVGRRLGLDQTVIDLARMVSSGAAPAKSDPFGKLRRLVELTSERRYIGGRDFIRHHRDAGGDAKVWEILSRPPTRMSVILRPEIYGTVIETRDWSATLVDLERHVRSGPAAATDRQPFSDGTPSDLNELPAEDLLDAMASIEHVQERSVVFDESADRGEMSLFVLNDAAFGPRLADLREARVLSRLDRKKKSSVVDVGNERREPLAGIDADFARVISYTIRIDGGYRPAPMVWAIIGRDQLVLELAFYHFKVDDAALVTMAREALDRAEHAPPLPPYNE